jgi:D-arabinitol dehydrogenase (NADP+)
MKAVVYDAPTQYTIKEIPVPDVGPGEVRIKVHQVGVCGTDLHIHHGDFNAVGGLNRSSQHLEIFGGVGWGDDSSRRIGLCGPRCDRRAGQCRPGTWSGRSGA